MAKRKEVILQEILNNQDAWNDAMSKPNLYVVDAHQKWCGPCIAIVSMLKRIKNELGDDLLKFATAEIDSIDSLEQYRGKCEPNFLFFGSGQLIAAVRGCNAPLIQSTIESTLAAEHKVLAGETERKVISDLYSPSPDMESIQDDGEELIEDSVVPKKFTVALVKPDVVENGQVDEIIVKIQEAGIDILANDERMLTEEEAKDFYKHKSEEDYFDELINYVTSGPCRVLLLTKGDTGEGVVEQWRNIIGPFDAAVAKNEQPNSLRSIYGENATRNALHGSMSEEEAVRELGFFYPNYNLPTCTTKRPRSGASRRSQRESTTPGESRIERTLALIRPDALRKHKDAILQKIAESGFQIAMQKEVTLTTEQAEDFYSEHRGKEYFTPLVKQMTCGPVLALCLASDDAVGRWRKMLGPKEVAKAVEEEPESLRAQFQVEDTDINMLHGSDTVGNAESELSKLFKLQQTVAVIKPDAMTQRETIKQKLNEAGFMISCQKDINFSKEIAGTIYKSKKGTEFYDDLVNYMTSGNTLTMVLSAENAVQKLRDLMGPADPDEAKTSYPDSLRAKFATTIMENAIHGASTEEDANDEIKLIFGDVEFNWDGETGMGHEDKRKEEEVAGTEAGAEQQGADPGDGQVEKKKNEDVDGAGQVDETGGAVQEGVEGAEGTDPPGDVETSEEQLAETDSETDETETDRKMSDEPLSEAAAEAKEIETDMRESEQQLADVNNQVAGNEALAPAAEPTSKEQLETTEKVDGTQSEAEPSATQVEATQAEKPADTEPEQTQADTEPEQTQADTEQEKADTEPEQAPDDTEAEKAPSESENQ